MDINQILQYFLTLVLGGGTAGGAGGAIGYLLGLNERRARVAHLKAETANIRINEAEAVKINEFDRMNVLLNEMQEERSQIKHEQNESLAKQYDTLKEINKMQEKITKLVLEQAATTEKIIKLESDNNRCSALVEAQQLEIEQLRKEKDEQARQIRLLQNESKIC